MRVRAARALAALLLALVTSGALAGPASGQEPEGPTTPSTALGPPRTRITQETPDLTGVVTLWVIGVAGTVTIAGTTWWRGRPLR